MAEFLAAAGLTAMAAAFLVPAYGGVQKYLLKMQAERAAQCLAGDIAALQQYSFYDISGKSRLEMDADKGGYRIYYGGKLAVLRKFENGLYFDQHFNALKFSGEGAPSAANNRIKPSANGCRYSLLPEGLCLNEGQQRLFAGGSFSVPVSGSNHLRKRGWRIY